MQLHKVSLVSLTTLLLATNMAVAAGTPPKGRVAEMSAKFGGSASSTASAASAPVSSAARPDDGVVSHGPNFRGMTKAQVIAEMRSWRLPATKKEELLEEDFGPDHTDALLISTGPKFKGMTKAAVKDILPRIRTDTWIKETWLQEERFEPFTPEPAPTPQGPGRLRPGAGDHLENMLAGKAAGATR